MPTKEKLESALRNADAAGDVEAARQLANVLKSGSYDQSQAAPVQQVSQPQAPEAKPEPQGQQDPSLVRDLDEAFLKIPGAPALGEFAAAANRSIFDMVDFLGPDTVNAVLELAGSERRMPTMRETFGSEGNYMEEGLGRDAVQMAGETAPMAVAFGQLLRAAAGRLPAASQGESAGRGVMREAGKTTGAQDASLGAVAGAGTAAGEEVGGEAGGVVGGIVAPLSAGSVANKVGQVGRAITNTSVFPEQRLVQDGRDAGIPVLTSDALPPKTFPGKIAQQTGEKIPLAGTAGTRETQQQMRQKAVEDVADRYGEFSYDAIIKSLKDQKSKVKNAAGSVLSRVGKDLDDVGEMPTDNTRAAIERAKTEFEKPGVIASQNANDDLGKLIAALEQPQTFISLKENRTAFREIVNSTDKADRSQMTSRAKSLMDNVYSAMTKDMDRFAAKNLPPDEFRRWKRANAVYKDEAEKLTRSKLKNILDKGDVTPESVSQMLFSRKPSEQKMLYDSLTNEGRSHARSAIISKIINDLGRRAQGMTPNSFASELNKYNSQVGTFFKGAERKQLEGLQRVLQATRRAQDAAVTTPTGQQLIGGLSVTGLAIDPIAALGAAGTVGGLARLYESAPVRKALLKLASAPKGSGNYDQALLDAQLALQTAAQKDDDAGPGTEEPRQQK